MLRALMTLSVLAMLLAAGSLYVVNTNTRGLEGDVRKLEREKMALREQIAILKADRAFLARPIRIEALARGYGMRPATISQLPERGVEKQFIGLSKR